MKSRQTADELIFQETPGCLWFLGFLFFFVGGIFVYGALGGFNNWDKVSFLQLGLAFTMGAIAVSVGVWQISRAPVTKLILNQQTGTIIYTTRGLFGKKEKIFDFDQVKRFRAVEDRDSDGDPIWYFGIEFRSGKIIKISSLPSHFENSKQNLAFEANKFLQKQAPSYKSSYGLEDETREKIS